MSCNFMEIYSLETRQAESLKIRSKYPDRIPIIVEKAKNSNIPDIDKKKFICPGDLTIGQFMYVIRKRMKLGPEVGLFLFIGGTLVSATETVNATYEKRADEDGFLYVTYAGENTFGSRVKLKRIVFHASGKCGIGLDKLGIGVPAIA